MGAVKVGIREFREKLASDLLESEVRVAITRHGDTVGYYVPARRKRVDTERTALKQRQPGNQNYRHDTTMQQLKRTSGETSAPEELENWTAQDQREIRRLVGS